MCDSCGGLPQYSIKENGHRFSLCARCLDKKYPHLAVEALRKSLIKDRASHETCPYCKTTLSQAKDTGLVGCPLCYEVFPGDVWNVFGINLDGTPSGSSYH
jgi:protein-arginine kinase activator protein McsA